MISKEEFQNKMLDKMDDLYEAYVKSSNKEKESPADVLLRRRNDLPEFKASNPIITEEEKQQMIFDLEKATDTEKLLFTIGKIAFIVGVKSIAV